MKLSLPNAVDPFLERAFPGHEPAINSDHLR